IENAEYRRVRPDAEHQSQDHQGGEARFAGGRPERVREVEPQSIEAPGRPLVPALVVDLPDAAELEPRLPASFRGVHAPGDVLAPLLPETEASFGVKVALHAFSSRYEIPPAHAPSLPGRRHHQADGIGEVRPSGGFNLELLPPLSRQRVKFGFPAAF